MSTHIRQPGSLSAIWVQNSLPAALPRIPGRLAAGGSVGQRQAGRFGKRPLVVAQDLRLRKSFGKRAGFGSYHV